MPIPAKFFPWVVMTENLLLEKLVLLMELSTAVVQMHQGIEVQLKCVQANTFIY
jgi:hypothetical protein